MLRFLAFSILLFLLCGCAAGVHVNNSPTNGSIGTITSTVTPTTGSPTHAEVEMPTLAFQNEGAPTAEIMANEQIVMDVNAFLNAEGEYSDKTLSDELFVLPGNQTEINHLGLMSYSLETPNLAVQEILLGGEVKGDFAYFILGTQGYDQNHNQGRFVHVGVFPVTTIKNIKFGVMQTGSKIFSGTVTTIETLDSIQMIQDFIQKYNNKPVVTLMYYGDYESKNDNLTDEQKAFIELMNSTTVRSENIVNRLNNVMNGLTRPPTTHMGYGADTGIYDSTHPITVEAVQSLSFNPSEMTGVWGFYVKSR